MKIKIGILLALAALCGNGTAQGFVNLDFEEAQIIPVVGSPYYPYGIATSNALPGWAVTAYSGTNPVTQITYNDPALGSAWVTLWATNGQQISGNFSALLQGGTVPSVPGISISQIGMVPTGTESLLFEAQPLSVNSALNTLVVSLGGQEISYFAIATEQNYTLYAGNIPSTLTGQVEQLMFSALEGSGNNWTVDDIQFSPSSVPEPSAFALSALGGLFFAWRRWRKSA